VDGKRNKGGKSMMWIVVALFGLGGFGGGLLWGLILKDREEARVTASFQRIIDLSYNIQGQVERLRRDMETLVRPMRDDRYAEDARLRQEEQRRMSLVQIKDS
jgi:hypothetical protein